MSPSSSSVACWLDLEQPGLRRAACGRGGCGRSRGCGPSSRARRRGLSGAPSRGQRSAAIANASWVASSARSKSPRKPISAASTRPHWSRKACSSIALTTSIDRAHLDRAAHAAAGILRGELDRRVEVVGLEEQVAAERLLHLDERAVGGQRLAVLHPHGRCHLAAAASETRGDAGVLVDRLVGGVDRFLLLGREARPRLGSAGSGSCPGGSAACTSSLLLVEWSPLRRTRGTGIDSGFYRRLTPARPPGDGTADARATI